MLGHPQSRMVLENELNHQAITAPLSGRYKRCYFETLFERERLRGLRAADKALYDGRSAGRNRVVMAESH